MKLLIFLLKLLYINVFNKMKVKEIVSLNNKIGSERVNSFLRTFAD